MSEPEVRLGTPLTRTAVDVDPSWSIGGRPHGGYLLSTMVAAALDEQHPHPMAVSAHYVASPSESAAVVEVERLRTGRRVASSRLRLTQDDDVKVEVLLSSGRWTDDAEPHWSSPGGPPALPPLEDCPRAPSTGPGGTRVGQLDHTDLRPIPRPCSGRSASRRVSPRCAPGSGATTAATPRCSTCWCSPTRCRR
jgi:hypothetical protein